MEKNDSDTAKDPSYDPEGCMTNSKGDESDIKEPRPSTSGKKPLKSVAIKKSSKRKVPDEASDDTDSEPSPSTTEPLKQASSGTRKSRTAKETVPGSRYPKKAKPTSSETSSDPEKPKARSHHKKSKCP